MDLEQACKNTGALKCEFPPDDDPCETCDKLQVQLYFIQTCYDTVEGEYHCADCIITKAEQYIEDANAFAKWYENNQGS